MGRHRAPRLGWRMRASLGHAGCYGDAGRPEHEPKSPLEAQPPGGHPASTQDFLGVHRKTPTRGLPARARVPTLQPVSQRAGTRAMTTTGAPAPAARGDDSLGPSLGPACTLPRWAELLTALLDDAIAIPGTKIRFGLDGIVGMFLPGAGDAVTALGAGALLLLAVRRRVPRRCCYACC
jgi:hypothetical protein